MPPTGTDERQRTLHSPDIRPHMDKKGRRHYNEVSHRLHPHGIRKLTHPGKITDTGHNASQIGPPHSRSSILKERTQGTHRYEQDQNPNSQAQIPSGRESL